MSKPLTGKRWFYALGQSDKMRGIYPGPRKASRNQMPGCWPDWAKTAYLKGWYLS